MKLSSFCSRQTLSPSDTSRIFPLPLTQTNLNKYAYSCIKKLIAKIIYTSIAPFVRLNNMNNTILFKPSFIFPDNNSIVSNQLRLPSNLNLPCTSPQTPSNRHSSKGYQCTDELMLPDNFEPGAYSVICGRGQSPKQAVGNRRLGVIASLYAQSYSKAKKKEEKSQIVSEILEIMRSASPEPQHAFVRQTNGHWFRVQNHHAREKIGTVLRDVLHSKYRSSTKSKLATRRQKKCLSRQKQQDKVSLEQLTITSMPTFTENELMNAELLEDFFE